MSYKHMFQDARIYKIVAYFPYEQTYASVYCVH